MQSIEPMMMGSPTSQGAHAPFLPAFLMGDPAPTPTSPPSRLWATASGSSPKGSLPMAANRSGSWASGNNSALFSPSKRDMLGGRSKDKTGAPPVQGLLEHITSPLSTPDRKAELLNQSARFSQSFAGPATPHNVTDLHTSSMFSPGADMSQSYYGGPRKTPPSPAQVDPFYTQGEMITPDDDLDSTWITVFGFPAAATSFILQQFSQYGNILKHVISSEGNWLHIQYQSKLQAKKALSKNGKVFGSSIMVGVSRCIDKNVMEKEKDGCPSLISTPTQPITNIGDTSMHGSNRNTPIRPLTAAYRAASSDHDVSQLGTNPQKNTNVVSKALEYMFGW